MDIRRRQLLLGLLQFADLAVVTLAFCAAKIAADRGGLLAAYAWSLDVPISARTVVALALDVPLWHVGLRRAGLYGSYRLAAVSRTVRDVGAAAGLVAVPVALVAAVLQRHHVGVAFVGVFLGAAFAGLVAERLVLRALGRTLRRRGRNLRYAVVVGEPARAFSVASELVEREHLGYRVVDLVDVAPTLAGSGSDGSLARLARALDRHPVDEVFVALPFANADRIVADAIRVCDEEGVVVRLVAHLAAPSRAATLADTIAGRPVVTIASGPHDWTYVAAKRILDVVLAGLGLVVAAPLFLVVAIAIKVDSPGPVFFAQERVGRGRRPFRAYKFRSMVVGAERLQPALEDLNEAAGPVFKIREDPRITSVGRWLRRTSLDELPQLANVVRGDMSLVGPRPLPLRDVARIDVRWHRRRFSVKPGITCLWQVSRRTPEFDAWVRSDMEYIDNCSLALDLKILARTVPAVLSR
ncbi:MAG TPA: sugar transferase, partial [Candidatus Binatia bacterium]|nr:sugar transferase [Candidatus Binatia bacterium]